jgi:hypothetical protein
MPLSVTKASPEECDEHRREEKTFAPGQRLSPDVSPHWLTHERRCAQRASLATP